MGRAGSCSFVLGFSLTKMLPTCQVNQGRMQSRDSVEYIQEASAKSLSAIQYRHRRSAARRGVALGAIYWSTCIFLYFYLPQPASPWLLASGNDLHALVIGPSVGSWLSLGLEDHVSRTKICICCPRHVQRVIRHYGLRLASIECIGYPGHA